MDEWDAVSFYCYDYLCKIEPRILLAWGGSCSAMIEKQKYARRYKDNYMYTDLGIKGHQFYFITDSNNVIYDYGIRTNGKSSYYEAQLLPYGGSKAYNVYGYDENGYDNKGYKTDGYNDAGYDRDGYDRKGFNSDGYDREGYDKSGYNANGYDRSGYKKDGFNDAGYDKDGYDKKGYNDAGFDRDGYDKQGLDRDSYNKDGYKEGYYNFKNVYGRYTLDDFDRNGISILGFNKDGVYKDGYVYTNYTGSGKYFPVTYDFTEEWKKGKVNRWYPDGRKVADWGAWDAPGEFNFEVINNKNIRDYYTDICLSLFANEPMSKNKSKTRYKSAVVYITVPQSYVNRKGKKTNIYYLGITRNGASTGSKIYKITSRYMKVQLHFGDSIKVGNYVNGDDGSICMHPFSYKYIPSTKWVEKSSMTKYNGKLINAFDTKVNITHNKTKTDMVYLANIDYRNIVVSSSNSSIVKVRKVKTRHSTAKYKNNVKAKWMKFDRDAKILGIKLTGGSKKGTATITIKDKKSGKTEKIKVTNK